MHGWDEWSVATKYHQLETECTARYWTFPNGIKKIENMLQNKLMHSLYAMSKRHDGCNGKFAGFHTMAYAEIYYKFDHILWIPSLLCVITAANMTLSVLLFRFFLSSLHHSLIMQSCSRLITPLIIIPSRDLSLKPFYAWCCPFFSLSAHLVIQIEMWHKAAATSTRTTSVSTQQHVVIIIVTKRLPRQSGSVFL